MNSIDTWYMTCFDRLTVACEKGHCGRIIGIVSCGICSRPIKLLCPPLTTTWPIHNLKRHLDTHRIDVNRIPQGKKRRNTDEQIGAKRSQSKSADEIEDRRPTDILNNGTKLVMSLNVPS